MERYLAQLAAELDDSEAVASTAADHWSIYLDDDVEVQLRLLDDASSAMQCVIGACPAETDALERLLLANFSGRGTLDGILGADAKGESILLRRFLQKDCNYQEFRETLEDFFNSALFWRQELPKLSAVRDLQELARRKAT